jgi:hypothetical protein
MPVGAELFHADGQDMKTLIGAFRNFAMRKAPNTSLLCVHSIWQSHNAEVRVRSGVLNASTFLHILMSLPEAPLTATKYFTIWVCLLIVP